MPLDNLRAFVDAIDAAGELARVDRAVSVDEEITEAADRCKKSPGGGPTLLFRHPTLLHGGPSRYPVAVKLCGSARRLVRATGRSTWPSFPSRCAGPKTVGRTSRCRG